MRAGVNTDQLQLITKPSIVSLERQGKDEFVSRASKSVESLAVIGKTSVRLSNAARVPLKDLTQVAKSEMDMEVIDSSRVRRRIGVYNQS